MKPKKHKTKSLSDYFDEVETSEVIEPTLPPKPTPQPENRNI